MHPDGLRARAGAASPRRRPDRRRRRVGRDEQAAGRARRGDRARGAAGRAAGRVRRVVSVDTYKPAVAEAAIDAGASIVNDPSGLIDPDVADICAETGAALVITHTRARPKQKLHRPHTTTSSRTSSGSSPRSSRSCEAHGVREEQIMLCPGPDMGKDPAQTIELLRRLEELAALGRPLLLARLAQGLRRRAHEPPPPRAARRDAGGGRARRGARRSRAARARRRRGARLPDGPRRARRRARRRGRPAARGRAAPGANVASAAAKQGAG